MSGRLLILDDDAAIGQTIRLIARSRSMEARATSDASVFFDLLDEWQPTHIALDLIMPGMDGVEVLGHLATRRCRARIIITSGVAHRVLEAAGRSAGERGLDIAGVLSKPFTADALRALLVPAAVPDRPVTPGAVAGAEFEVSVANLRQALARREMLVLYQPKVACANGSLAGFEALVRWRHPLHGIIAPDRFVPLAEQCGLIDELTEQVLDLALTWFQQHFGPSAAASAPRARVALSLNISARTLRTQGFVETIVERCRRANVEPGRLIFELTEISAMEDPTALLDLLTRLRMKGFQLSIDDFGTGFSSMLQLVRLPFSEIKVDKSFVMTAMTSQESRSVIKSIVELGRSLGLHSTAEGVDDAQTMQFLRQLGCDRAQGYYIAHPMEGDKALRWMAGVPVLARGDT